MAESLEHLFQEIIRIKHVTMLTTTEATRIGMHTWNARQPTELVTASLIVLLAVGVGNVVDLNSDCDVGI